MRCSEDGFAPIVSIFFISSNFCFKVFRSMPALINMCIGQYVFKFALAALDTPLFYILTRRSGKDEE